MKSFRAIGLLVFGFMQSTTAAAQETVLVAGATGQTGRLIVQSLIESGYEVRALSRSVERISALGDDVERIVADVTKPETLGTAMQDIDVVISAIGGGWSIFENGFKSVDWEGNRNLIDAALTEDVRQFVLISAGSAGREGFLHRLPFAPYAWKAKSEKHLRESGLAYTILGPGGLRDQGRGSGIRLASRKNYTIGTINRVDLADVSVAVIGNEAALSKTITLVNDETLPPDSWRTGFATLLEDNY